MGAGSAPQVGRRRVVAAMVLALGFSGHGTAFAALLPEDPKPAGKPTPAPPVAGSLDPQPGDEVLGPWLRVQAGVVAGRYDFTQVPGTEQTLLYPKEVRNSSGALGYALRVRAFVPVFPYVGIDLAHDNAFYVLDPAPLCAAIDNECSGEAAMSLALPELRGLLVGRYAVKLGSLRPWVGAGGGASSAPMTVLSVEDGQEINLDSPQVTSLALGGMAGVETEVGVFVGAEVFAHLAGASTPVDAEVRLEAGYVVLDYFELGIGGRWWAREFAFENREGESVGAFTDTAITAVVSLGGRL